MDIQTRHDIFEPDDQTALVCVDEAEVQRAVVEQLGDLGYRIHTGLFAEDISLKLRAHTYDLVAIYETFAGSVAEGNPVLIETTRALDNSKKRRGVIADNAASLRLDKIAIPDPASLPGALTLDH